MDKAALWLQALDDDIWHSGNIMELIIGLALIAYYTWWILLLIVLLIIIIKLMTQQNFQVAFRVGITSNSSPHQPDQQTACLLKVTNT